ncbi:MAG: hypothetical protein QG597_1690 [Actinomycetota bacterium]|nr:hypothetical protein [Actinomycetota bacterium]
MERGTGNGPGRVFVFDSVLDGDVEGMSARTRACYTWARLRGVDVIDEVIAWPSEMAAGHTLAVRSAVQKCRWHGAALLVHSTRILEPAGVTLPDLAGITVVSVNVPCPST